MRALVVTDKSERVFNFHQNTLKALKELLEAAGLQHPYELGPEHVLQRISASEVRPLAAMHHWLKPGELLAGIPSQPVFEVFWGSARADSFGPPDARMAVDAGKHR